MRFILFSKFLKEKTVEELAEIGQKFQLSGYDLCVRPGYAVTPENAGETLPAAVEYLKSKGLEVPMVTAPWDLRVPSESYVDGLMAAMDKADVRMLKLGYFNFNPFEDDYQSSLLAARETLRAWMPLALKHNVKICYHTHSNRCIGLNGAGMAHLLEGLPPKYFGAYVDPAHLCVEGEEFPYAMAMVKPWVCLLSVKDVFMERVEENGHGKFLNHWLPAGNGCVNWTYVFQCLKKMNWDKPISIHCEFKCEPEEFLNLAAKEVAFFQRIAAEA